MSDRSEELLNMRKDISADVRSNSVVVELLLDAQRRVESLAKVLKTKNSKYARIDALSKNIAREEAVLRDHRRARQSKKKALAANLESIDGLQKEIAARSERINQLEQFAGDFKSSQKDLNGLHAILGDYEHILRDKEERLPGTLITIAAFAAYCGPLGKVPIMQFECRK